MRCVICKTTFRMNTTILFTEENFCLPATKIMYKMLQYMHHLTITEGNIPNSVKQDDVKSDAEKNIERAPVKWQTLRRCIPYWVQKKGKPPICPNLDECHV
ncbi:hypothetical protein scyTo_0021152 [Scyliorhinus torazame]|uniref:Uncharacterized protein n=1 Tax=Scyliorhinus torazame TaxID=75743 RepID=A0A401PXT3_SCYTO|nr:hypothetical protein [Scyliorhinus torazame]